MLKCYNRDYGLTFRYVNALHPSGARSLNSPATIDIQDSSIALSPCYCSSGLFNFFNESSRFEAAW